MRTVRRPIVAVAATSALLALQALIDPTGLLALVGWPGGSPQADLGWPLARYLVFVPVMLAVVWWAAVRAGDRYWTMTAGVVLAALLAQATTVLAMTWDPALAGWASGYITAKAVPSALIVAGIVRIVERVSARRQGLQPGAMPRPSTAGDWAGAVALGAAAPLLAGSWWTGAAYAPLAPTPRADSGVVLMLLGVALLVGVAWLGLRWMRRRVPGVLGGWLGALVAGGLFGLAQAIVGFVVDDGLAGDLWPLMAAYIHVADGLAFGACIGWLPGVVALAVEALAERRRSADASPAPLPVKAGAAVATVAIAAIAALLVAPLGDAAGAERRAAASAPAGFLRVEGGRITDGDGNEVLLRGANVNQLVDFYQARAEVPVNRELSEQDYADMASYGFDVVRLNLSWSALEPEPSDSEAPALDPTYLASVKQAVAWGAAHGVRTVLDMHQDGWSNASTADGTDCRPGTDPMWGYDGAPAWATQFNDAPRCSFTGRDISPAGDRAFEHFWFDTDGIRHALARTWGELAGEFADDPAVAGFDLLNEPGFGETAPVTTSQKLGEFSGEAIEAIRAAGAPQIVFVEPSILWSGLGFDSGPARGFTDDANVVFSPHLYAESITMDASLGLPTIVSTERQFELGLRVADELGMPLWSGEYGYWGDPASIAGRITRYAAEEDRRMLGSAYWVWKQSCGDPQNGIGPIGLALVPEDCATGEDAPRNEQLLGVLSRAYPKSVPGELRSLSAGVAGDDGANFSLTGFTGERGCGLEVWIPGAAKPSFTDTSGLSDVELESLPGGWRFTACADGEYALATGTP
ncbi:Aryl-phospho-beta-D-glucosidase BglC, GH1 family [Agromyces sp. CF514]|uniref:cellulase family glycosylhydrolase n=1 Tax=Agromyces sp. CF514 TaxID=1881031 RepID=UPI0008E7A9D1|nr:cellulase family glycosylhydrolase [Agromyces sp. CF514]SFR74638.1 Aryl-phospho-beta-D-glucosidase BglC, GH1 family [Agromyces sp. CF514]